MTLRRLVLQELQHRSTNFLLALLGVVLAIMCVTATLALLRSHDRHTESVISAMEIDLMLEMESLEDNIRKSMKGLGFNIYIFPEGYFFSLGNINLNYRFLISQFIFSVN